VGELVFHMFQVVAGKDCFFAYIAQVVDGLVAEEFYGFTNGVLQIFGYREGVFMGTLRQCVE